MDEFLSIGITMTVRVHPLLLLEVIRHKIKRTQIRTVPSNITFSFLLYQS